MTYIDCHSAPVPCEYRAAYEELAGPRTPGGR
jgi:hypothetical protein